MDNFDLKKYLAEGRLLKEFTTSGGRGIFPKKEEPGDMFQQQAVEELMPNAMASRDDKYFQAKLTKHADWTEQSAYNNTFVHVQYDEGKSNNSDDTWFIHQSQNYNHNYDDWRNPKFTELYIVKNKDKENEEKLGTYIVDTDAYIKDLKDLRSRGILGKTVSENKLLKEYDDAWVEKYLSKNGTKHISYKSGKGVEMKEDDWAKHKGGYTINNGRIGYIKDDGSLHSVKLPVSVGENESLMRYMNDNYEKNDNVPVVSESLKESGKRMKISQQAANLVDGFELEDLERNLKQIYREMEQEAEPEGGPIADQYADEIHFHEEAIRFIKNKGKEKAQLTYDQAIGREEITDETGTYTIGRDGVKNYTKISVADFNKSSKFDRNLEENFNLRKYLAEGKLLKEFVGGELEKRSEVLFDKLVPGQGSADTVEGEMLRAINRIVYRYYNDGDEYLTGYGTETVGPAHAFLVDSNNPKKSALTQIFRTGTDYETTIKDALELILDYIESRNGEYTPNNLGDMFDYKAHFENEEDYDDWDDDYYDEEEEEY